MFDEESGQVFTEWSIPGRSLEAIQARDWSRKGPRRMVKPRGPRGPRSLVNIAISCVAENIGAMENEHLEGFPVRLLNRIWAYLEARGICLQAWKLCSPMLLEEDEEQNLGLYRFRQHICRPSEELSVYTTPLSSHSVNFIAHLVISGRCEFTANEMTCLADMKNLGVLELLQPAADVQSSYPEINDRLLRGWSDRDNPFPLLRILRIWGDESVTQDSLRWVSKFPSLTFYDVQAHRAGWKDVHSHAERQGWRLEEFTNARSDSILPYMLIVTEAGRGQLSQENSRSRDSDLIAISSDSRCAIKFVPQNQAQALVDLITDTAKAHAPSWDPDAASRETRACQGITFEAWAFWLYSLIGQIRDNKDLKSQGLKLDLQAIAGPFALPAKPMISLFLGHNSRQGISYTPAYVRHGIFATKSFVFTRSDPTAARSSQDERNIAARTTSTEVVDSKLPTLNVRQKRKRVDGLMQYLFP